MIGPPEAVSKVVLAHQPLSVALFVLMIEWMTQSHYVDSVRGEAELDPLFANLLRCHWIEEAQHAKLDTLMVEALAEGKTERELHAAVDGFLEIVAFFDMGCQAAGQVQPAGAGARQPAQAGGTGADRAGRAPAPGAAWTYLGSGMIHKQFRATLGALSHAQLERIDALAPKYC